MPQPEKQQQPSRSGAASLDPHQDELQARARHHAAHGWSDGPWFVKGGTVGMTRTQRNWLVGQALELHTLAAGDLDAALRAMVELLTRHEVSTTYGSHVVNEKLVRHWLTACWRAFDTSLPPCPCQGAW